MYLLQFILDGISFEVAKPCGRHRISMPSPLKSYTTHNRDYLLSVKLIIPRKLGDIVVPIEFVQEEEGRIWLAGTPEKLIGMNLIENNSNVVLSFTHCSGKRYHTIYSFILDKHGALEIRFCWGRADMSAIRMLLPFENNKITEGTIALKEEMAG